MLQLQAVFVSNLPDAVCAGTEHCAIALESLFETYDQFVHSSYLVVPRCCARRIGIAKAVCFVHPAAVIPLVSAQNSSVSVKHWPSIRHSVCQSLSVSVGICCFLDTKLQLLATAVYCACRNYCRILPDTAGYCRILPDTAGYCH